MAGTDPRRNAETLPQGYTLHGRYVIGKVLGQGGFGITYLAEDRVAQRHVALKELFPAYIVNRSGIRVVPKTGSEAAFQKVKNSFSKETMMLVQIQDIQDVVRLYHAFQENGTSYYVMEYLEGCTLNQRLRRSGPMSWQELSRIMAPVILTLARLHKAGVIHRDVSPDNIFLKNNGETRLIDFGNVRSYDSQDTPTAYIKGGFAPIEQFSSVMPQGPFTDVYSTAVTIYYALSGRLPPGAAERFAQDRVTPLKQLCPQAPDSVCAAVARGMAVQAQERTQNMEQLYQNLFGASPSGRSDRPVRPQARPQTPGSGRFIRCQAGLFPGRTWQLPRDRLFTIGRNADCDIAYPVSAVGVSRVQVSLYVSQDGRVLACDKCSSYGTIRMGSGGSLRMQRETWYDVSGCLLCFGAQEQYQIG